MAAPVAQASNPPPAASAQGSARTPKARALLAQARKAIDAGDLAKARQLIDQARALKPDLQWYEDNPDKLQAELARADARTIRRRPSVKTRK